MTAPIRTQTSFLEMFGQMDHLRSGKVGRFQNDGDVHQMNGFAVDVSGSMSKLMVASSLEAGAGVNVVPRGASSGLLAPGTLAATIQLRGLPQFGQAEIDAAKARGAGGYVTAMEDVTELEFTPVGAEAQSVEYPGYIPGDVLQNGTESAHLKRQVERTRDLADLEASLSVEYGVEVKLAFDPMAQEYVMLRPGQAGYDRVTSARDVYAQVLRDPSMTR